MLMGMSSEMLAMIDKEIARMPLGNNPASLYEPIRYIMGLGGKRFRPMLTLLSYSIYGTDPFSILKYAAAVEAFHNFTLMHDDIMDKAPLRRGKQTVHEKFNVNTAILSGDVMLVKVYEMFLSLPEGQLRDVLGLFNRTASEVCEGQQLDMDFETMADVSEAEYLEMIRLKTAVLLGFSLELGALLGNAPKEDRAALYNFGVNIGIGFQLNDDLLDVYGSEAVFGKTAGGDIVSNKKTFLLIKALELAKGNDKAELLKWISSTNFDRTEKVAAVTKIYNNAGVQKLTEETSKKYFEAGYACIEAIKHPNKQALLIMAEGLSGRMK